jgi:hypothetical protein
MKHSLKTATLAFSVAVLLGSVPVAFADSTDTTSSSNTTTTTAEPGPAVVYAAPAP